jgi:hypothetical protein
MNSIRFGVMGLSALLLAACGGKSTLDSSGSGNQVTVSGSNVATAVVNAGPAGDINTLFTSVTICAPGSTTNCQTIDNIEIDTGSSGLRILASALTADLPIQSDSTGSAIAECTQFAGGAYSWGPIALADLTISGETAASLPVQVIGDANFATVPADCAGTGTAEDTVAAFGANGILGVGTTAADCGAVCADTAANGFYYTCATATTCVQAAIASSAQVQNPVTFFPVDNNGVIIELPSVASTGAASVTGAIVFGVDTESNNASSGSATLFAVATTTGFLTVSLGGTTYPESFLDTGSNGYYFNDPSDTALVQCSDADAAGFYCPASTLSFSATVCAYDADGTCSGVNQSTISFSIGNADTLFSSDASYSAFPTAGGTFANATSVDLGLPFFYGRNVYEVFEGHASSDGSGPYFAF